VQGSFFKHLSYCTCCYAFTCIGAHMSQQPLLIQTSTAQAHDSSLMAVDHWSLLLHSCWCTCN
jgi:hypothetical protein